jgi:hypothetical protein
MGFAVIAASLARRGLLDRCYRCDRHSRRDPPGSLGRSHDQHGHGLASLAPRAAFGGFETSSPCVNGSGRKRRSARSERSRPSRDQGRNGKSTQRPIWSKELTWTRARREGAAGKGAGPGGRGGFHERFGHGRATMTRQQIRNLETARQIKKRRRKVWTWTRGPAGMGGRI